MLNRSNDAKLYGPGLRFTAWYSFILLCEEYNILFYMGCYEVEVEEGGGRGEKVLILILIIIIMSLW